MSSFNQRPRSICRQRGLQNGMNREACGSKFLPQVGQRTCVMGTSYSDFLGLAEAGFVSDFAAPFVLSPLFALFESLFDSPLDESALAAFL